MKEPKLIYRPTLRDCCSVHVAEALLTNPDCKLFTCKNCKKAYLLKKEVNLKEKYYEIY